VHGVDECVGEDEVRDRYELEVSSGVADLKLDTYTPKVERVDPAPSKPRPSGKAVSALEIMLDGVEARVKSRRA
jgi:hypothetical protein